MSTNRARSLALGTAMTLALGALAGCGDAGGSGSGASDGVYKLGGALALSGDQATLGEDFATFLEYGVSDANEEYADEGIEIDLELEDNAGSAEQGVAALNKLATVAGVPMVTTGWSASVNAMAPMAEDLGVAVVNAGANAPELEGASPLLANFYTLASVEMQKFATHVHDELGFDRAAVIYTDNPTGEGGAEVYRESFEAAGGEVVAFESIAAGAVDVSSVVTKVLAADPETVHVHTLSTEGATAIQALRDQSFDGQITTYAAVGADSSARDAAGPAMNGVIYSTVDVYDAEDARAKELLDRFQEDHGRAPVGVSYAMSFYDSVFLYAELVKRLKDEGVDVTGEALIEAIQDNPTFQLPIQGEVTFTDSLTLQGDIEVLKINDSSGPVTEDESLVVVG